MLLYFEEIKKNEKLFEVMFFFFIVSAHFGIEENFVFINNANGIQIKENIFWNYFQKYQDSLVVSVQIVPDPSVVIEFIEELDDKNLDETRPSVQLGSVTPQSTLTLKKELGVTYSCENNTPVDNNKVLESSVNTTPSKESCLFSIEVSFFLQFFFFFHFS